MIPYTTIILPIAYSCYKIISSPYSKKTSFDIATLHAYAAMGVFLDFSGMTIATIRGCEKLFSTSSDAADSILSPEVIEFNSKEKKCLENIFTVSDVFQRDEISKLAKEVGSYLAIKAECQRIGLITLEKCEVNFFDTCFIIAKEALLENCCDPSNILEEEINICSAIDCSGKGSFVIQDIDPILSH